MASFVSAGEPRAEIYDVTHGEVGELLAGLFVGEDCDDDGGCVMILLVLGYSLNDLWRFDALPARCEKLSRYDLLLCVNIVPATVGFTVLCVGRDCNVEA